MLKNMTLDERLQRIDEFFERLTADEFENMCYECGAGKAKYSIEPSCEFNNFPVTKYANLLLSETANEDEYCLNESIFRGAA